MKVIYAESGVVNSHCWLCGASFIANSSNDSTCGNGGREQRKCITHSVLV